MQIENTITELGYVLPPAPQKGGVYAPCKEFGNRLVYISGCVPTIGSVTYTGKLGKDISFEDGQVAAQNCMLNILAVIKANIGDLDRVKSFVKVLAFVASDDEFYQQPQIANAATELLVKVFGEGVGCPSRSAIGVNALPGNSAVEIEALIELKED